MPANPCHIAVIVLLLINVVLIGIAAIFLDWTKTSGGNIQLELRLFVECADVDLSSSGSQSLSIHTNGCRSWDSMIGEFGTQYCDMFGGGPSNDTVKSRVRIAEALIMLGGIMMLVHSVVVGLWAFGVIKNRWVRILTSLVTAGLLSGGGAVWRSFITVCDTSFCDAVTAAPGTSCGYGPAIYIMAVVVVIKFLCFIPLRCIKRPCDDPNNAACRPINAVQGEYVAVPQPYPQVAYGQPVPQPNYGLQQEKQQNLYV